MKVLITGGAGFIGSNLCRSLLDSRMAHEVRVLDDLSTGSRTNLAGLDVQFTEGTILDIAAVQQAAADVDLIVHLGAIPSVPRSVANPRASHEANKTGTLNVLEAAREVGIHHVIVDSSSSVYGSNPKLLKSEEDYTRLMSPYAVSKLATEGYALAYQSAYGLKTLPFRFFNVFGQGQAADHAYAAVVPKFIDAALAGRPLQIHGDGMQSRDFTFVQTVCQVIGEAIRGQASSPSPITLAFNTNTTLLELIAELERLLGHSLERQHVEPRVGDVKASQADSSKVLELFPDVEPVELSQGLQATLEWFKSQRSIA